MESYGDFEPYWYVYRRGTGDAPTKRHNTFEEALKEAQRLTNKEGKSFYVFQAVAKVIYTAEVK